MRGVMCGAMFETMRGVMFEAMFETTFGAMREAVMSRTQRRIATLKNSTRPRFPRRS